MPARESTSLNPEKGDGRSTAMRPKTTAKINDQPGGSPVATPTAEHQNRSNKGDSNSGFHAYPFYAPRFWHGMRPLAWLRLIRHGRYHFSPSRFPHAIGVSFAVVFNTILAGIQYAAFYRRLSSAELHGPPVFIIGHWRSGTTLLHELMVRDERYSSPSTYQCFAPHHFLLTEWFFRRFLAWLLPGKRPMDNMQAGWERPQEDEFAIMNLGQPSPYRRIAFPNEGPVDMDFLDFEGVDEKRLRSWLSTLRRFLLTVSTVTQRPLVIKSPTHTGRIKKLADEFPEARFIHMTRDPKALFPSTRRLWRGLCEAQALQVPTHADENEYVNECFQRMYNAFEKDSQQIDEHRLIHVRYEDLAANPLDTMQTIYSTLRLSDFESARASIEEWARTEHKSYQTNQHSLSDQDEALIKDVWGQYAQRYGYEI
ncbi:sulfotransferase family protein [Stieleria marina]|uniref:Sulfotransferase domain protein n=1 Tax=Stieleria marina TaxID=1930275 RepID=A0A517NNY3_9BACT|nr:Sulfotransferase domain protein [Planctomycetes bacterium K23_9]